MKIAWLGLYAFGLLSISVSCAQNKNQTKPMSENPSKPTVSLSEEEWKQKLTPMQYFILRQKGTERPFTGGYWNHFERGTYVCAGCKTELFTSDSKFYSSCGWPSYFESMADKIKTQVDKSHGMIRTEVLCKSCDGHLGHVFEDGPEPSGLRYCINSEALEFVPKK